MIAYEIQLRYVIRDKIQSETNSVQDKIQSETNSVQDKIQSETKSKNFFYKQFFFCWGKIFYQEKGFFRKKFSDFVLDFQCTFFELSRTNRCLSSIDAYTYRNHNQNHNHSFNGKEH